MAKNESTHRLPPSWRTGDHGTDVPVTGAECQTITATASPRRTALRPFLRGSNCWASVGAAERRPSGAWSWSWSWSSGDDGLGCRCQGVVSGHGRTHQARHAQSATRDLPGSQ